MINKYAIIASIVIHLIIVGLSLVLKFQTTPTADLKQIEILDFGLDFNDDNDFKQSIPKSKILSKVSNEIPEQIALNQALIKYDNFPEKLTSQKINTKSDLSKLSQKNSVNSGLDDKSIPIKEIENESPQAISDETSFLDDLEAELEKQLGTITSFNLEGEISNRKVLKSVLPEFPSGIQKSAAIKIFFSVNSAGTVIEAIIDQKAVPDFEKVSLEALKKWKFNSVPGSSKQSGYITFNFNLN